MIVRAIRPVSGRFPLTITGKRWCSRHGRRVVAAAAMAAPLAEPRDAPVRHSSVMTRRAVLRAAAGVGAFPLVTGSGAQRGGAGAASGLVMSPTARRAADPAALQHGARVAQSFGTDLFRSIAADDGNVVCSPYSVAVALAMTRNGARGSTAEEMDRVLHAASADELNAGLNALTRHVESLAHDRARPDGSNAAVTLDSANSLWGQQGMRWEQPFLDALAQSYGTGLRPVDYGRDVEIARRAINEWTSDQTHARIRELLVPGILDSDTRLVLVNAIYLKAPWATPFSKGMTQDASFTCADGWTVRAPMMRLDSHTRVAYTSGAGWRAVDLPYDGGGLAMAVVVPDAGRLEDVVRGFDGDLWRGLLTGLQPTSVALRMPRWTFRTHARLDDLLAKLGMPTAFTPAADFTALTHDDHLWIGAVVHEAFVAVGEEGTEAAAATAVGAIAMSGVMTTVTLTVDRPFLFVLHDTETGTPLFIGRVSDPTAAQ
jgi:serine protease inhibitor